MTGTGGGKGAVTAVAAVTSVGVDMTDVPVEETTSTVDVGVLEGVSPGAPEVANVGSTVFAPEVTAFEATASEGTGIRTLDKVGTNTSVLAGGFWMLVTLVVVFTLLCMVVVLVMGVVTLTGVVVLRMGDCARITIWGRTPTGCFRGMSVRVCMERAWGPVGRCRGGALTTPVVAAVPLVGVLTTGVVTVDTVDTRPGAVVVIGT